MSKLAAFFKSGAALAAAVMMNGLFPCHQAAAAQSSDAVPPGPYALLCGDGPIPRDAPTIPWIGCFYLSAGHSAAGTFANQKVEVSVDATGNEAFKVNGTVVATGHGGQPTNVPTVRPSGSGYWFCPDAASDQCPSGINIHSRGADKSVFFVVTECLPPQDRRHVCVMKQKDWDFEKSAEAAKGREAIQKTPINKPNVPMPPGPYASWPADIRGPAVLTVRFRCMFVTGMALSGPTVPKVSQQAMRDVLAAVWSSCVASAMPDDWPEREAELEKAKSHRDKVGNVWPASLDLAAMGKQIGQIIRRQAH